MADSKSFNIRHFRGHLEKHQVIVLSQWEEDDHKSILPNQKHHRMPMKMLCARVPELHRRGSSGLLSTCSLQHNLDVISK